MPKHRNSSRHKISENYKIFISQCQKPTTVSGPLHTHPSFFPSISEHFSLFRSGSHLIAIIVPFSREILQNFAQNGWKALPIWESRITVHSSFSEHPEFFSAAAMFAKFPWSERSPSDIHPFPTLFTHSSDHHPTIVKTISFLIA